LITSRIIKFLQSLNILKSSEPSGDRMQEVPWPYSFAPSNFIRSKRMSRKRGPGPTRRHTEGRGGRVLTDPRMISSTEGKIVKIILWIPFEVLKHPDWIIIFQELISKLPEHSEIVVAVHNDPKLIEVVKTWTTGCGDKRTYTLVPMPPELNFSIWAQDPFVIVLNQNTNQMCVWEPMSFMRYADASVAEYTAPEIEYEHDYADVYFQGGNILTGDTFYLLGYDYIALSRDEMVLTFFDDEPRFIRAYEDYLDPTKNGIIINYWEDGIRIEVPKFDSFLDERNWYIVDWTAPGKYQPIFHIDMFLTLGGRNDKGKYKVFVGDPSEAARILDEPLTNKFAKPEVFKNIIYALNAQSDFEVIPIPLPLTSTVISPETAKKELEMTDIPKEAKQVLLYYFATYNNCIVEISDGHKDVWMPTYGYDGWSKLKILDDAVEQIWTDHGFRVHRLGNYHPFMLYQGGPHCLIQYLARG
jgi:hypothetical protein